MQLKRALVSLATAGLIAMPLAAHAAPAPITNVELNVPSTDFVGVNAAFNPSDSARIGLPALKKLRGEMWDVNPPIDGVPLQDAARKAGLDTKEAYVNAVKGNGNLTIIGIQRAMEAQKVWGHKRPFTANCPSTVRCEWEGSAVIASNGVNSWGQNLAKDYDSRGLEYAISQQWGHGELQALKDANGFSNQQNGHLRWLLHPNVREIGFGAVFINGHGHYTSAFGPIYEGESIEFREDSFPNRMNNVTMFRSADGTEAPTGITAQSIAEGATSVLPLRLGGFEDAATVSVRAPEGFTATVDKATGDLTIVAPSVDKDTTVQFPVTVSYEDGSVEQLDQAVVVKDRPALSGGNSESSAGDTDWKMILGIIAGIVSLAGVVLGLVQQLGIL